MPFSDRPQTHNATDTRATQALGTMLEGSEAMSACMNAELLAWVELQLPMLLVRRLGLLQGPTAVDICPHFN